MFPTGSRPNSGFKVSKLWAVLPVKGKEHPRELKISKAPPLKACECGYIYSSSLSCLVFPLKKIILKDFKASANISYCTINA
jgi:hypothetical protein